MNKTTFEKFMSSFQTEVLVPESIEADDERRDGIRHIARQHVALNFRGIRLICDLVDLSESGAKISVGDGIVPNVGDRIALTLFDGTMLDGTVTWLRDKHLGLEFLYPIPNVDERLDFENLGREFFGRAVTLQKSTRRP
ncbi:PilZ domain-containing protein [Hyphomicrobium sp. DY-1]|uniref:PilZ domain-containing protein n=1 Tax=Hyphomicrobium sp. DY-1 TaxID=3075650 RepID=UPI0039C0448B